MEIFTKPGTDKIHGNFQFNGNASQFNSGDPLTTTAQPPYHTIFSVWKFDGAAEQEGFVQPGRVVSADSERRVHECNDCGADGGIDDVVPAGR